MKDINICNVNKCNFPVLENDLCHIHNKQFEKSKYKMGSKKLKISRMGTKSKKSKKPKRKTIASLKKQARYYFQRWLRITKTGDGVECCYGCGKYFNTVKGSNSCHYLKCELYPAAIFDVDNLWVGCPGCNIRDPLLEYRKWLVNKKGIEFVENLENKYKLNRGTYKWDREFLNNIIEKYKKLCKDLES